jgi:HSP20 family protein
MTNTINSNCNADRQGLNQLPHQFVKLSKSPVFNSRTPFSNKVLTNIKSLKDAYVIELAIPGFNKENVSITFENSKLKITGSNTAQDDKILRREYQIDQFEKVFSLPENVDDSSLQATMENGILKVYIALKPVKEAHTITIK